MLAETALELGDPRPQLVDVTVEPRRRLAVARAPESPPCGILGQPEVDGERSETSGIATLSRADTAFQGCNVTYQRASERD